VGDVGQDVGQAFVLTYSSHKTEDHAGVWSLNYRIPKTNVSIKRVRFLTFLINVAGDY
jgi:hypothetical protein